MLIDARQIGSVGRACAEGMTGPVSPQNNKAWARHAPRPHRVFAATYCGVIARDTAQLPGIGQDER
jgi:phage tail sheath gpL-like